MSRHTDALCDSATRGRALEVALIAHLLLNPRLLEGRTPPKLSAAALVLLGVIDEGPACARADILAHARIQLAFARRVPECTRGNPFYERYPEYAEPSWHHLLQCTRRARYGEVMRMAQVISGLTVSDLTFLTIETVLDWLGAVEVGRTDVAFVPPKQTAVAPWKRRRRSA